MRGVRVASRGPDASATSLSAIGHAALESDEVATHTGDALTRAAQQLHQRRLCRLYGDRALKRVTGRVAGLTSPLLRHSENPCGKLYVQPLTTPSGRSRATRPARPAVSTTDTTLSTSL